MAPIREVCKICNTEVFMLLDHVKKVHNIERIEYIIPHFFDGIYPICKCGCGEKIKLRLKKPYKIYDYITGHNSKGSTNPNFGKHFSIQVKAQMRASALIRTEKQRAELGCLPHHTKAALKRRGISYSRNMMKKKCAKFGVILCSTKDELANSIYKYKCNTCNNITTQYWNNDFLCYTCHPKVRSVLELDISTLLTSWGVDVQRNNRSVLKNHRELDIYLPDYKLGIEINGLYYHSELSGGKDKMYHIDKTLECEQQGIQLVHLFEDEWINKKDIVISRLAYLLNKGDFDKIYAKNCIIKEISNLDKNTFLEENHLQGKDISPIRLGCYANDKLVSIMTFSKPSISKGKKASTNGIYELSRFCSDKNTSVVGAAGKLFSYFIKNYNPNQVFSYADRRWSTVGAFYDKIGFKLVSETLPGYWYVKPGNMKRYHRFSFTKQKTIKMGGDPNSTEWANMQKFGFDRVWDCGNWRFELVLKN